MTFLYRAYFGPWLFSPMLAYERGRRRSKPSMRLCSSSRCRKPSTSLPRRLALLHYVGVSPPFSDSIMAHRHTSVLVIEGATTRATLTALVGGRTLLVCPARRRGGMARLGTFRLQKGYRDNALKEKNP